METKDSIKLILRFLEAVSQIPADRLKEIVRILEVERTKSSELESKTNQLKCTSETTKPSIGREKKELIGSVPYLLTNQQHFPNNESIVNFAKLIGINIPNWKKKKKDEILGRIIIEILKFHPERIYRFNRVVSTLLSKAEKGEVRNFFQEWDEAIKQMSFRP